MKFKQEYRIGIGISAMLLIFVMISIVTFGVLSYLSAKTEKELTDKSIEMLEGYYQASAAAQRRLFTIDNDLSAVQNNQELLIYAQQEDILIDEGILQFSVDAGGDRVLNVSLLLDESYQIQKIMQYYLESKEEWNPAFSELPIF